MIRGATSGYRVILVRIYLAMLFFMPLMKVAGYRVWRGVRFTLSDLLLVIIILLPVLAGRQYLMKDYFGKFVLVAILFFGLLWMSFFRMASPSMFFMLSIPWVYALLLLIATGICLQSVQVQDFVTLRNLLVIIIVASFLVPYYELFTGQRLYFFFHSKARYAFLLNNPNQYGVFTLIAYSVIVLVTFLFRRNQLKWILLLTIGQIFPTLLTGSRSGLATFALLALILLVMTFMYGSARTKGALLVAVPIAGAATVALIAPLLEDMWVLQRALSVFELLGSGEALDQLSGGGHGHGGAKTTGDSIAMAVSFWKQYPLFGIGFGSFTAYARLEVHNTYLSILSETGIVGMTGFLLVIGYVLYAVCFGKLPRMGKLIALLFMLIFMVMNIPHMLLRERWVWFFFSFLIIISMEYDRLIKGAAKNG